MIRPVDRLLRALGIAQVLGQLAGQHPFREPFLQLAQLRGEIARRLRLLDERIECRVRDRGRFRLGHDLSLEIVWPHTQTAGQALFRASETPRRRWDQHAYTNPHSRASSPNAADTASALIGPSA